MHIQQSSRSSTLRIETTYTQHIIHQRPLPGPNLDQLHPAARPPLRHPLRDRPDADELAKDLRDLRRGDEVAFLAENIAATAFARARVVSAIGVGEDLTHECGDGDGTCCLFDDDQSVSKQASN